MAHDPEGHVKPTGKRRGLPVSIAVLRCIASVYLFVFKRFRVLDASHIPDSGALILVANHTTAFDPVCLQVASKHRLIRFMQARELYNARPLHYLFKWLNVIPVNRTGHDTASIRAALRTLLDGGCLGIYPEGKISEDGNLHEGHKGVALLALLSNATVVPAYLHGARPFCGMIRNFLQFDRVTLYFGPPIRFDDLAGRHRDQEALDMALQRIMHAIQELHDRSAPASVPSFFPHK